ncbi:hypothetical protein [Jeotgalibacillus aurantiacus]|uniref:hypothetical protein n=1 Tax=Jeotgalibacillus aurantiacus TaxID=2763266 RepID=UPI001D0A5B75|nr:hypothetical protein [Jeotgalibacillus aurantiacus]
MKRLILFIVFLTIITAGCADDQPVYIPLSSTELEQFIEENGIEPLAIEELQGSTIVLSEQSIYYLSKSGDEIIENRTSWSGNTNKKVHLGITGTGSPHAQVIIHDEQLLSEAHTVEVRFSDGKTTTKEVGSSKGLLLFYDKNKSNLAIHTQVELSIYDREDNVIYTNDA